MPSTPLSGEQHTLRSGGYLAVIASVGASLRSLTFDGRDLVVPFEADEVRPSFRGATLAPWPNRVTNGRYEFAGTAWQVDITEPARGHALHGFASWLDFEPVSKGHDHLTLQAAIEARTGYPWRIIVTTTFTLDREGLAQSVQAHNDSEEPAPWGTGPHPYLVAGPAPLDEWTLELPANDVLLTDATLSPVLLERVDASDAARFDFRTPGTIGSVELDHAFSSLRRDARGMATVRVTDPSGTGVAMTWDAACPWVQIHTADMGAGIAGHRAGLAVEPMTCAPDAFNAAKYPYDAGLVVLQPDATAEASWRIGAT